MNQIKLALETKIRARRNDMEYKTDVQRRLAEILDELKIKATYYNKDGIFSLEDSGYIIYEDDSLIPNSKTSEQAPINMIRIYEDGTLKFIDNSEVTLKYCKTCQKFSFGRKVKRGEDYCPVCKGKSIKYLFNNSRIPGWFGKDEDEFLIDEQEAELHIANCYTREDDVKQNIEKLKGKVCYITITSEKKAQIIQLKQKYPNMSEVIDYLVQCFEASRLRKHKELAFRPIVLVGGPGCGKTSFVTELCMILLGHKAIKIDLGNGVPHFAITGSDPSYGHAKHGLIIEAMFKNGEHGPLKNPIIHFDELDKIHSDEDYSIETVFYSILEKNTARRFFDNFIGINVDASGVNYIFTANTLKNVPAPIINRLRVFQIPDYTHEQMKEYVIDSFYQNWLENNNMEKEFLPAVLSDDIKEEILSECNDDPRNVEDAINLVFNRTMQTDDKTGHKIALFSPKEYFIGWQNFRGKREISESPWKLPAHFLSAATYPNLGVLDQMFVD